MPRANFNNVATNIYSIVATVIIHNMFRLLLLKKQARQTIQGLDPRPYLGTELEKAGTGEIEEEEDL